MNFFSKIYNTQVFFFKKIFSFLPVKVRTFFTYLFAFLFLCIEFLTVFLVIFIVSFTLFLNTEYGTLLLTKTTQTALTSVNKMMTSGLQLEVEEFSLVDGIKVKNFELKDDKGIWLEVGSAYIDFAPSQLIQLFSKTTIKDIVIDDVNFYRLPELRESEEVQESSVFEIPNVVLPLPLGEIIVENIEINRAFISEKIMALDGFGLDLHADIKANASLERDKATLNIDIQEKETTVTGIVEYTPGQIYADLNAVDSIWGKTFSLINSVELELKTYVRAKEFPLSKDAPLIVDVDASANIKDCAWLYAELNPKIQTSFSFDSENIVLKNTKLEDSKISISIPNFGLNVKDFKYEPLKADFSVADIGLFYPMLKGSAKGDLNFSGEVFNMLADTHISLTNFDVMSGESSFVNSPAINTNAKLEIILEDGKFDLLGMLNLSSEALKLYKREGATPADFSTEFAFDLSTFALKNFSLEVPEITLESSEFALILPEDKASMPKLDGAIDFYLASMDVLGKDVFKSGDLRGDIIFSKENNQEILFNTDIFELNVADFMVNTVHAAGKISNLNRILESNLPHIEGDFYTSALTTKGPLAPNIPQTLFESSVINFAVNNNSLMISAETYGEIALASVAAIEPFSLRASLEQFSIDLGFSKQKLELLQPTTLSFSNGLQVDSLKLELQGEKEKAEVFFSTKHTEMSTDVVANINFPLALLSPYTESRIPQALAELELAVSGSNSNPKGNFGLTLTGINITRNEELGIFVSGAVENKNLAWSAFLGNDEQVEIEINGNLPLVYSPYFFVDFNKPFNAKLDWVGNISTLWQFVPLAGRSLKGNGKIEVEASGTLKEPIVNGHAYISKAIFEDDILGILISDIDLEANLGLEESTLNLYARDGTNRSKSSQNKNALFANGRIYLENDTYMVDFKSAINSFEPLVREDVDVNLSGTLNAHGALLTPQIIGNIQVNNGFYKISTGGGTSVTNLENVEFVKSMNEIVVESEVAQTAFNPFLIVSVNIPDSFNVSGMGLKSNWGGSMTLFGSIYTPLLVGSLQPKNGTFDFLSNQFEFGRSIITFTGNMALPIYDISVENSNEAIESIIRVTGVGSNVSLDLSSVPPYPTDEIIARMLFGKPLAELSEFQAIQVGTTAATLLSPGLNKLDLLSATKDVLGLEVLRLNSNSSSKKGDDEQLLENATIEAGGYLTDSIYFGVERGLEDTAVKVEVELYPNVTVEGRVGTDSSQAGIKWSKDY